MFYSLENVYYFMSTMSNDKSLFMIGNYDYSHFTDEDTEIKINW